MAQITAIYLLCLTLLASSAEDRIITTCRTTPNPQICEASLRSDPRSSTADTEGLILIMIDVVSAKFTDSLTYVKSLMKHPPPKVKARALTECVRLLEVVINVSIPVARTAVKLGNPKFGEGAMLDAAVEASMCGGRVTYYEGGDEEFKEAFTKRMLFLSEVSNVAASMIRVLL